MFAFIFMKWSCVAKSLRKAQRILQRQQQAARLLQSLLLLQAAKPQQSLGTSGGASTAQKTQSGDRYSEDVPVT